MSTLLNNQLKLGLPKGSLEDSTIDLFSRAGWKIHRHVRNYFPDVNDKELAVRLCKVQEMPLYVQDGILDIALTGKDWLLETNASVITICDLVYSKASKKPARWVLAVNNDSPYRRPEDLEGKRIATELMGMTKRYFQDKGINVHASHSYGATEAKVVEGLVDAIVEVTETETTIRAHGLRIIDEVLSSNTILIANKAAYNDPVRRKKIDQIQMLLQGALRAEALVCIKMNAPTKNLDKILSVLPALNSPTVSPLQDTNWCSLETVVDVDTVRDLIPQLKDMGAEGILEFALNKVI